MDELTSLARAAGHGDRAALARLIAATQADVWRLCAHLADSGSADDLAQETFLRAIPALRGFRGDAPVRSWLFTIAARVCAAEIRARQRDRALAAQFSATPISPATPDPSHRAELNMLVAALEPDRRAAFVLTQLLGCSYAEAAAICGCPEGTIRSRIARARADLIEMTTEARSFGARLLPLLPGQASQCQHRFHRGWPGGCLGGARRRFVAEREISYMRVLLVGAGGVGTAVTRIAARRAFLTHMVVADYDLSRAEAAVAALREPGDRFSARRLDAADVDAVRRLLAEQQCEILLNATDPRFVMPLFNAALSAGAHYLDMAMSLSAPHASRPYEECGVKLGDEQFGLARSWEESGRLALVGMGVEPGLSDVFARYAADELFDQIEEIGVRDGASLTVEGYDFAPTFSIWTTIEECLNPPVVYEKERGWFTTAPFSEPEVFDFPEGIGPVECVNVEHEEVLLIPRWVDAQRVTFKYGLGDDFIAKLKTLHALGLDATAPVTVPGEDGPVKVSPRDVVAACLPDPAALGDRMTGKTCAGTWVKGSKDGRPREVYLYHVVDNQWSMREYGSQAVVWQTAVNPVIALELLATGAWSGTGVLAPEALPPRPFLDLLTEYGSPWGQRDLA